MQKKYKRIITGGVILVVLLAGLYVMLDFLFALSEQPKNYISLTKEEQEEIKKLSEQCGCTVKVRYDYIIRDGEAIPKLDSNSKYSISFNWEEKEKNKSICGKDTSYLKEFALSLLPELFEKMRYIKDYHTIDFYFSVDDDLHPIKGVSCSKHIIIKR